MIIMRKCVNFNTFQQRFNTLVPRMKLFHTNPDYVPLLEIIKKRKNEAKRSIIIQVKGKESVPDLYSYCSNQIGSVKGIFYYKNQFNKTFPNFYIVEFEDELSVEKVISTSAHVVTDQDNSTIPVTSPFLWLSGARPGDVTPTIPSSPIPLYQDTVDADCTINKSMSLSEQLVNMSKISVISESHSRVRFLLCRQIELTLQGMFHNCSVVPFGSSVNGFGQIHGDQDMILLLNGLDSQVANQDKNKNSRLVFHSKSNSYGGDKGQTRRYCDQVSNLIRGFLPGCQDVQSILFARVPIIKYRQELVGIECDLSLNSSSGLFMSSLLHLLAGLDWRVRPLASFVKEWAKSSQLVKDVRPTNYFTNFTLIMLVVCYLQQVHKMLPPIAKLNELGTENDHYLCEDKLRVNFLHNIAPHMEQLNPLIYSTNPELFSLVRGFFVFYSEFNFNLKQLNPISGLTEPKDSGWSRSSAMNVINPLDPGMNVSYNLNQVAVKQFVDNCKKAIRRCDTLKNKEGNALITELFGKQKKNDLNQQISFPNLLDLGLGKEEEDFTIKVAKATSGFSAAPSNTKVNPGKEENESIFEATDSAKPLNTNKKNFSQPFPDMPDTGLGKKSKREKSTVEETSDSNAESSKNIKNIDILSLGLSKENDKSGDKQKNSKSKRIDNNKERLIRNASTQKPYFNHKL